jgi:ATP-dependent DNA helicase PIF1
LIRFILRRDGSKLHQYNIRGADPDYLIALKQFLIQEGGISKTPSTVSRSRDEGTCSFSGRAPLGDRTKEISSQLNRTRDRRTGEIDNPLHPSPNKRNPKARKKEPQQLKDQEQMTSKQKQILQAVLEKKSLFFTGSAGTGKSFLLRCILSILAPKARIYATGTTGIAAYHIGGITLHHFAGIDSRPYSSVDAMVQNICKKKDALTRWKSVQILVIDEISMLDGDLFDDLEQVARRIRKNESFFGGIQVVLCGDFFQVSHWKLFFFVFVFLITVCYVLIVTTCFEEEKCSYVL